MKTKKKQSKIRFKIIEKGKPDQIVEFRETKTRRILLSTGLRDIKGVEIWEGDQIQYPKYTSGHRRKRLEKGTVEYLPPYLGKVTTGLPINDPPRFHVKDGDTLPDSYRMCNWNSFFESEVINDR